MTDNAPNTPKNLQPLSSLGPMQKPQPQEVDPKQDDPVRLDYLEARGLLERGEYAQAAMGFHNALRGYEERGDRIGVANCADRLGDACLGRGEHAMALANYERAYAICVQEEDSFSQLSLNKKIVQCLRQLGQHERALTVLDDMLEHYQLTRNPKGAVETLEIMAEVYLAQGDRANAAEAYRAAAKVHASFKHAHMAEELRRKADLVEQG